MLLPDVSIPMTKLQPGTVFEDSAGYLFWILCIDEEKNLVYVQDDPIHVLTPCTRVIRIYNICEGLEKEFTIRSPTNEEAARFLGVNRTTFVDSHNLDTIPAPPNFESFKPTSGYSSAPESGSQKA
jgi:hypothetical protein